MADVAAGKGVGDMGSETAGKKVAEFALEGRCPEAKELAEKAREASEHLQAAAEILERIGEVELAFEVIACGSPSRSGGSASIPEEEE